MSGKEKERNKPVSFKDRYIGGTRKRTFAIYSSENFRSRRSCDRRENDTLEGDGSSREQRGEKKKERCNTQDVNEKRERKK